MEVLRCARDKCEASVRITTLGSPSGSAAGTGGSLRLETTKVDAGYMHYATAAGGI
jgi:hypothetical protein